MPENRSGLRRSALGVSLERGRNRRIRGTDGGVVLDDVHSRLNATRVARVVRTDSLDALRAVVLEARRRGEVLSIAGGRHAMGGQQFATAIVHIDTCDMRRILELDLERGEVEVEAGIQWPELIDGLHRLQRGRESAWGIAQKQTGANELSIGGALASNVHGRGLAMRPFVGDVEAFTLIDARGEILRCSRTLRPDLFRLVIGGYGLFGLVYSVRLRLVRRQKLERVVVLAGVEELADLFEQRIRDGYIHGDFQFDVDERSERFLDRGVFACYRPVDPATPMPQRRRELSTADWLELLHLAHVDKSRAFERYSAHYSATNGQIYWSDLQQLGHYPEDYHRVLDRRLGAPVPGSEMITELYVPRHELPSFLAAAAATLRGLRANVIYGTIRLIEKDEETFLAWARERWACIVFNLHVDHTPLALEHARITFRALIDIARERSGTYYLTYHRWATREQLHACHPRIADFMRAKLHHDPEELFQSEWWRSLRP